MGCGGLQGEEKQRGDWEGRRAGAKETGERGR